MAEARNVVLFAAVMVLLFQLAFIFLSPYDSFSLKRGKMVEEEKRKSCKSSRTENGGADFSSTLHLPDLLLQVRNAARESVFRYDRSINLPLLKLNKTEQSYTFRVHEARKWLKSQKLVIAAAVRNSINGVQFGLQIMKQLAQLFHSVTVVFVENDSKDNTRSFLYEATKQSNDAFRVFLLGCGTVNSPDPCHINISYASSGRQHTPGHMEQANRNLEEESTDRGFVMAALRNMYLHFIYDRVDADLLLVLESDLQWQKWDFDSVAQGLYHFKTKPQLDSLCAFVTWSRALHDPCTMIFFNNKHFYVNANESQSPFLDRIGLAGNAMFKKHIDMRYAKPEDFPKQPVKVAACFQGATFYRMSSLRAASAFYRYSEGEWHCEHSTLSKQLSENYLDTQMSLEFFGHFSG